MTNQVRPRPSTPLPIRAEKDLFEHGGEMGALMSSIDWSKTPVGPVSQWSQALRTTVGMLLRNRFPILLWWGPRYVQFYNDTWRPIAGQKHPRSMGQPGSECFPEIWHILGPMVDQPFQGGSATANDDLDLLYMRRGFLEEAHFKVAYSPVPDETVQPTGVGGVIATVAETTDQVFAERQLRTLRELGLRAPRARTSEEACAIAGECLKENSRDIPFGLFYLIPDQGARAQLVATVGFGDAGSGGVPQELDLDFADGRPKILTDLHDRWGRLPTGWWAEPPRTALAIPLSTTDQQRPYGILVCGTNPHRSLDEGYRGFLELVGQQVVSAIRNARALEEERRRARALAEIDRAKTEFFSNVSHEFRTPLTLMLGPLEEALRLDRQRLDPAGLDRLETAHRNALRLLKLVNSLLDFSRIEAGRVHASFEPVDLAKLTEELASVFRSAVERAGLRLVIDCPPLAEPFYVDREMWEKVVLNLLSNAFKFTFEGEIRVRLRTEGKSAVLEIGDTGIGIPARELPNLFKRFHRIRSDRARTHEGTGIGLSLVQELVRLHGGSVGVASEVGEGTTISVTIPAGKDHLPQDRIGRPRQAASTAPAAAPFLGEALRWSGSESAFPAPRPAGAGPAGGRILLADDNADMRAYVAGLLGSAWQVEAVADGAIALDAARRSPPDLILSDIMMPRMDGFELLRSVREDPALREIPVILLSARAGEESRIEGLQAGADDYLVKPFSAQELMARVSSHLRLSRLRKQVTEAARKGEARVRMLLEQTPTVHWSTDSSLRITSSVGKGLAAIGLRPGDADGRSLLEFQKPEEALIEAHRAALAGFSSTCEAIYAGRIFECHVEPLRDESGKITGVLGIGLDRTERKAADEEILQLNSRLEERVRERTSSLHETIQELDSFAYTVAHDLRAPIRAVHTFGQMLIEDAAAKLDGSERDYIDRIIASAARMDSLITDLLTYTRIHRQGVALEELDLKVVVARVLEELRPELTAKRARVSVEPSLPKVQGNGLLLGQALGNLIVNAAKFVDPEVLPHVRISAERRGGRVRVWVEDNGIGIAPEHQGKLFQVFERIHPGDRYPGTGIGLAIVRRAAERMSGTAGVESADGKGSRFWIELGEPRR